MDDHNGGGFGGGRWGGDLSQPTVPITAPTILKADQILVMDGGRIVERGNRNELLKRNSLYSQLYEAQFRDQELSVPI